MEIVGLRYASLHGYIIHKGLNVVKVDTGQHAWTVVEKFVEFEAPL